MQMTIAQFAAAVGISPQAVYKRLETDLKPFVSKVGNKWMIEEEAVKAQAAKHTAKVELKEEKVTQPDNHSLELQHRVELLEMELSGLKERLSDRDKQIEALQNQLDLKDQQITASAERERNQQIITAQLTQQLSQSRMGFFRRLISGKKKRVHNRTRFFDTCT